MVKCLGESADCGIVAWERNADLSFCQHFLFNILLVYYYVSLQGFFEQNNPDLEREVLSDLQAEKCRKCLPEFLKGIMSRNETGSCFAGNKAADILYYIFADKLMALSSRIHTLEACSSM